MKALTLKPGRKLLCSLLAVMLSWQSFFLLGCSSGSDSFTSAAISQSTPKDVKVASTNDSGEATIVSSNGQEVKLAAKDEQGQPISNVQVAYREEGENVAFSFSDTSGKYKPLLYYGPLANVQLSGGKVVPLTAKQEKEAIPIAALIVAILVIASSSIDLYFETTNVDAYLKDNIEVSPEGEVVACSTVEDAAKVLASSYRLYTGIAFGTLISKAIKIPNGSYVRGGRVILPKAKYSKFIFTESAKDASVGAVTDGIVDWIMSELLKANVINDISPGTLVYFRVDKRLPLSLAVDPTVIWTIAPATPDVCPNPMPDVKAEADSTPLSVCFDACGSSVENQNDWIETYSFEFGDNQTEGRTKSQDESCDSAIGKFCHTYPSPGIYSVSFVATDDDGFSSSKYLLTVPVPISSNHPPEIQSLNVSSTSVAVGGSVQISAQVSDTDGNSLSYKWSVTGGNIQGTGSKIIWNAPFKTGSYEVTLTVSDGLGGSATQSKTIDVAASGSSGNLVIQPQ